MGHIQNGQTDFLPLQVCGRPRRVCWLGVQTCSHQLIALLDIKHPSSSLFKPSFVIFDFCASYLLDQS